MEWIISWIIFILVLIVWTLIKQKKMINYHSIRIFFVLAISKYFRTLLQRSTSKKFHNGEAYLWLVGNIHFQIVHSWSESCETIQFWKFKVFIIVQTFFFYKCNFNFWTPSNTTKNCPFEYWLVVLKMWIWTNLRMFARFV